MSNQAAIFLKLGRHYIGEKDYDLAINALTRAIELEPDNAHAYGKRGVAHAEKFEYEESVRDFDRAILLDFTYAGAYNNRALSCYRTSMFKEALADYDRAIELSPEIALFYANRGLARHRLGEYEEAIADYSQAIEMDPADSEALNHRGETHAHLGEYEKALADFDEALEIDPWHIHACANRALVASFVKTQECTEEEPVARGQNSSSPWTRKVRVIWHEVENIPAKSYCIRLYYVPKPLTDCLSNGFVIAYADNYRWYLDNGGTVEVGILKADSIEYRDRNLDGFEIVAKAKRCLLKYFTKSTNPGHLGPIDKHMFLVTITDGAPADWVNVTALEARQEEEL